MMAISRLKRRPEYLRVAGARSKAATPGVVLQALDRGNGEEIRGDEIRGDEIRLGFTASKRVGNAVVRNLARRRLKAAAEHVFPRYAAMGCDYVLIARAGTPSRPFQALQRDLIGALKRLKLYKGSGENPEQPEADVK